MIKAQGAELEGGQTRTVLKSVYIYLCVIKSKSFKMSSECYLYSIKLEILTFSPFKDKPVLGIFWNEVLNSMDNSL